MKQQLHHPAVSSCSSRVSGAFRDSRVDLDKDRFAQGRHHQSARRVLRPHSDMRFQKVSPRVRSSNSGLFQDQTRTHQNQIHPKVAT